MTDNTVRLILENGSQHGMVTLEAAQAIADEQGLDLVEVAPGVYKTLDQGKLIYNASKARRASRQRQQQTKEIQFRLKIGESDFKIKMNKIVEFLDKGDKVKVVVQLRGREIERVDTVHEMLARIRDESEARSDPFSVSGRTAVMVLEK